MRTLVSSDFIISWGQSTRLDHVKACENSFSSFSTSSSIVLLLIWENMRDEAASVNAQNTSARASLPRSLLLAWINGIYAKYLCPEVRVETSQDDQRFRLRCNGPGWAGS